MNFMCTLHVASRVSTLTTSGAHSVCGGEQFPFTTVYPRCSLSGGVFGARLFPRAVRDAVILFVDSLTCTSWEWTICSHTSTRGCC